MIKFNPKITIGRKSYTLTGVQRGGSAIYKDASTYLRIGNSSKIKKDFTLHQKMEKLGFPVAKTLGAGKYKNAAYFIEESLGGKHFGEIFKNETETYGHILNESFAKFVKIISKYTLAQLKTISTKQDWQNFKQGIHLDLILKELPKEKSKIIQRYKHAEKKLADFPFGIQHGDLTPFNIYPKGIIDLEDSFLGPIGYDIGSFLQIQNWFPAKSTDAFYKTYKLTGYQKTYFTRSINDIYTKQGLPKISDYSKEFNFTKGIWFTVRMHSLPKLQHFRYQIIKRLIA